MWNKLQKYLKKRPSIAIAYSGGLDSRFLAYAAKCAGCHVLLLHATGVHIPAKESEYAKAWASKQGLALQCIVVDVLGLEDVKNNSKQRCYFCKDFLLQKFKEVAKNYPLCDGTNAQDMQSHRPGLQALREQGIISPLADCGLYKDDIRNLAAENGLDNAGQKARPCLLTRLDYGLNVTADMLLRLAKAEFELEEAGLYDFRLRICPEPVLQTLPHSVPLATIEQILKNYDFYPAKIIVCDNISGFFDRV